MREPSELKPTQLGSAVQAVASWVTVRELDWVLMVLPAWSKLVWLL